MTRADGTVLVLADGTDTTADRVCAALTSRGNRFFRYDTAEFPGRSEVRAELVGSAWCGEIVRDADHVELEEIRSVYLRRPRPFEVPAHLPPPSAGTRPPNAGTAWAVA